MKNFTIFYLLIAILIFSTETNAQANRKNAQQKEQIKAQKIAFITGQLSLTPSEAQQFWPVYNEYDAKRFKFYQTTNKTLRQINNSTNLSDNELDKLATKYLNSQLQEAQLNIDYHKKFKKVLTIEKVVKLYAAEKKFRNMLLKRIREQKRGR